MCILVFVSLADKRSHSCLLNAAVIVEVLGGIAIVVCFTLILQSTQSQGEFTK